MRFLDRIDEACHRGKPDITFKGPKLFASEEEEISQLLTTTDSQFPKPLPLSSYHHLFPP